MREVLWTEYSANRPVNSPSYLDIFDLIGSITQTNPWSLASIFLLTVSLGIWDPNNHFNYRKLAEALQQGPSRALHDALGAQAHFGLAWAIALLIPAIIFYNAVAASFPAFPFWIDILFSIGLYVVLGIIT